MERTSRVALIWGVMKMAEGGPKAVKGGACGDAASSRLYRHKRMSDG